VLLTAFIYAIFILFLLIWDVYGVYLWGNQYLKAYIGMFGGSRDELRISDCAGFQYTEKLADFVSMYYKV
jgi:hypothetical protein